VIAPVMPEHMQELGLAQESRPNIIHVGQASQISRGEPAERIERRVMAITAYTVNDEGMDGRGVTASGEMVEEGRGA
jgi:hypothetical protein